MGRENLDLCVLKFYVHNIILAQKQRKITLLASFFIPPQAKIIQLNFTIFKILIKLSKLHQFYSISIYNS